MKNQYFKNIIDRQKKAAFLGGLVFFLAISAFTASSLLIGKIIQAQISAKSAIEKNYSVETNPSLNEQILELNNQINDKKSKIERLKKQSEQYRKNIEEKRLETLSLSNEISLLDNQVAKTKIDIETAEADIDKTKLEIKTTSYEIADKEKEIKKKKDGLANYLRTINKNDQINYLTVLLVNDSFSEFFNQLKYLENIQSNLRKILLKVISLNKGLKEKKVKLQRQKKELETLKISLEDKISNLAEEATAKKSLLAATRQSEIKFQKLLAELRKEQQQIDNNITSLERTIRKKLEASDANFKQGDQVVLSWPIPFKGITAYFHDPDYPFRYIFEHPAVDLRAAQGTPIRAPASGYVGRVRDGGFGYSYIMLIHSGGISTVYGHVSKIIVEEDAYVSRGQIIGYTGGTPGTPGAGKLTTGPHLHFEVRLNGIPVNPLDYLINP